MYKLNAAASSVLVQLIGGLGNDTRVADGSDQVLTAIFTSLPSWLDRI